MSIPAKPTIKRTVALAAAFLLTFSLLIFAAPPKASASYYSPDLIDNGKFTDYNSMGVNAIQSFLISKGSYLRSYHDTENCPAGSNYSS